MVSWFNYISLFRGWGWCRGLLYKNLHQNLSDKLFKPIYILYYYIFIRLAKQYYSQSNPILQCHEQNTGRPHCILRISHPTHGRNYLPWEQHTTPGNSKSALKPAVFTNKPLSLLKNRPTLNKLKRYSLIFTLTSLTTQPVPSNTAIRQKPVSKNHSNLGKENLQKKLLYFKSFRRTYFSR